jgi:uncharacterized protein
MRRAADSCNAPGAGDARCGESHAMAGPAGKRSPGAWLLLLLVRFYILFLSPFFGGACKFYPSCSNYAFEAIQAHGARRGFVLAVRRLFRCHPFTKGGFDPVPDPEHAASPTLAPVAASSDLPTVGCLGKPFARIEAIFHPAAKRKEELVQ